MMMSKKRRIQITCDVYENKMGRVVKSGLGRDFRAKTRILPFKNIAPDFSSLLEINVRNIDE